MDIDEGASTSSARPAPNVVIFILSGGANAARRNSLRKSWLQYLHDPASPLPAHLRSTVTVQFVISAESQSPELSVEQAEHGDIVFVDAPEGYGQLWRKALVYLAWLEERAASGAYDSSGGGGGYDYVMHADDDSFIRLDLLVPLMASWPRSRHYWGYIWDGTGNRFTAPVRNPANKSYMPAEQYPLDYYPPFASGCGFVLSRDLVQALVAAQLPDYRLLDPPFGIHLCGSAACVLPEGPLVPVHEERVRPYRPLPTFRADTLVQHYLRPEEMRPFYQQALESARQGPAAHTPAELELGLGQGGEQGAPEQLYNTLVAMGLLRR